MTKGVEVHVDWLEFTVRNETIETLEALIATVFGGAELYEGPRGMLGYRRRADGPYGVKVLWDGIPASWEVERNDSHVILPGDACTALGDVGVRRVMSWALERGASFTRVDLAGDDYARRLSPQELFERYDAHEEVVSNVRWWKLDRSADGTTFYLGAPQSDRRLRCYDKGAESAGAVDSIRHELQLRQKAAQRVVYDLQDESTARVWARWYVSVVDFRQRWEDMNVSRCSRSPWFASLVEDAKRAEVYERRRPLSRIDDVKRYLIRQNAALLAAVVEADGGDLAFLHSLLSYGRKRYGPRHLLMISDHQRSWAA